MGTTSQQDRIEAFWARYRQVVADRGAAKKAIVWYEKWARNFVEHTPDVRLKDRTPGHVKAYLSEATATPQLKPWQADQVVDAVHWLYADLVAVPWADTFPWGQWKSAVEPSAPEPSAASALAPSPTPGAFRDVDPNGAARDRFTCLLQRVRQELRTGASGARG